MATVTDIDGNVYETVLIGEQLWMTENLKVTHYNNGDEIPNITNNGDLCGLSTGAYCNYDNNPTNSETYGRLYNWYAVDDSRGVCPDGWHVPTDDEWTILTDYLGGASVAGGKMKETGLDHWNNPNGGATNESGFTGLPSGKRSDANGTFYSMGNIGEFWQSSESDSVYANGLELYYGGPNVTRYGGYKPAGIGIRCLADEVIEGCTEAECMDDTNLDEYPDRIMEWNEEYCDCESFCDSIHDESITCDFATD